MSTVPGTATRPGRTGARKTTALAVKKPADRLICQDTKVAAKAVVPVPRDERGRILKGVSLNPAGRKLGSRNRATLIFGDVLSENVEEIARAIFIKAFAGKGDSLLIRGILDKIYPNASERAVDFQLPRITKPSHVAPAMRALLAALADGQITPTEAHSLADLLGRVREALITGNHDRDSELYAEVFET